MITMTTLNKFIGILAISTFMIGASSSMAFAFDCDALAPDGRQVPGVGSWAAAVTQAKLQVGDRSQTCITKSKMTLTAADVGSKISDIASNPHFYGTNSNKVVNFVIDGGNGYRSELRVEDNNISVIGRSRSASANLRFSARDGGLDKITLMQIHIDQTDQKGPLAAIVWSDGELDDSYTGENTSGFYLTVRRTHTCDVEEEKELCAMNIFVADNTSLDVKTKFVLGIYDGQLRLKVNGQQVYFTYKNVFDNLAEENDNENIDLRDTEWSDKTNLYFKAGAYLNSQGSAHVQFTRLIFR